MKKRQIIVIALVNIMVVAGLLLYIESGKTKTYYIDLQKVYTEFELKKELEQKMEAIVAVTNEQLDSLGMRANIINSSLQAAPSDKMKIEEYNSIAAIYSSKSKQFGEQKSLMAKEYDQQIWSQLNEYVREYGREKNCDFIIAGNGDGSVMYSDGSKDITDKMIRYVNEKYQGK
jgi:outer membrane protein